MESNGPRRLFRFGVFETDERTRELRKQGRRLSLQGQPLQVLLMLLERPGELVARAEIQQRLWPDGTFVDFDHSLNTAVNKIREAIGDSAASPRFVETLARRGYRFIAPVEVVDMGATPDAEQDPAAAAPTLVPPAVPVVLAQNADPPEREFGQGLLTRSDEVPRASRPLVRALFLVLQVMYLCFYVTLLARLGALQDAVRGMVTHTLWAVVLLVVTAAVGIPVRLYLLSAGAFDAPGLRRNFLKIFPVMFMLDELWALAPFLLAQQIGLGLALAATAALLYVPFAQRSLILMGAGAPSAKPAGN